MPQVTRTALALMLAACGSTRARSPAQPTAEATQQPACPASFAQAQGTCTAIESCGYAEGTCSCTTSGPVSCRGGAMVRPDEDRDPTPPPPPPPLVWQCTPTMRADGCPGTEPQGACSTQGQRCRYGACCVAEYTCKDGQWGITMQACPP